jgi:hypothetical protein
MLTILDRQAAKANDLVGVEQPVEH